MSSSVEKIKERLSIVDVVSSYMKLDKAGASYKGKCPFHNEKTPSFFISPDRGTFYCFGCGAKGDIFSFVEQYEGLEFRQALVSLAAKAGVELVAEDPRNKGEKDEKNRLQEALEESVQFFEGELKKNPTIIEYLHKRGLTDESIAKWRIGYARNEWRTLMDHLMTKKVSVADMLAVGLIKKNETDGTQKFYDTFRGRIMFPIFDATGRPVAFSGRIFVDDGKSPKYLNSPATALFNKSEVLYGFDRAKTTIRRLNYSILVEGQMDLILSHQAGLANTVASSGTALTVLHLEKLLRLSPRVMFAFDSDGAGFNATKKSAEMALQIGMDVKVAQLPAGEDPASLVAKNPALWSQALKEGKHIIDFYTDSLLAKTKSSGNYRVLSQEIKKDVLPFVLDVQSETERAHFVKSISNKSGLKEDAIWDDLKALAKLKKAAPATGQSGGPAGIQRSPEGVLISRRQGIERRVVGVILWQEAKKTGEKDNKESSTTPAAIRKRFTDIVGEAEAKTIEDSLTPEKEKLIFEAEQYYEQSTKFNQDIDDLFINFEEEVLKDRLANKMTELHRAESKKDSQKVEEYLSQCHEITGKLAALRKNSSDSDNKKKIKK